MFFSARLKLISHSSREKQMAEPGSLGSHGGHLSLAATPGTAPIPRAQAALGQAVPIHSSAEAGGQCCGCWHQLQLALATGWDRGWQGSWPGFPGTEQTDRQTVILPLLISVPSWKICTWTTLTSQPQQGEVTTHFLPELLQPFCTSLSNAKSGSWATRALNQNEREWESTAQSWLYLLFKHIPQLQMSAQRKVERKKGFLSYLLNCS